MEPTASSVQVLEQRRSGVTSINRFLVWVVPLLVLGALGDLARWSTQFQKPLLPLTPSLEEIQRPLSAIPPLELPASIFLSPHPIETGASSPATPQVAVKEVQWRLLGVSFGATKRAYLEDLESKQSVWVTEGEQLGSSKVKEIKERSVVLEAGDKSYEIRM